MTLDELLEYLELEAAEEFEYFENLADLMEMDEEIPPEALYMLFQQIDMDTFCRLLEDYFEDMLGAVPDDAVELYTLLDTVKMALAGMAGHIEEEKDTVYLADEFYRFRRWFALEPGALVSEIGGGRDSERELSVRDALTLHRLERLGGTKYDYVFDRLSEFEMDQYTVSFADLAAEEKTAEFEVAAQSGGSIQGPEGYDPDSFIEISPEELSGRVLH